MGIFGKGPEPTQGPVQTMDSPAQKNKNKNTPPPHFEGLSMGE